jgi:hypothetical protein
VVADEFRFTELFEDAISRKTFDGALAPPILSLSGTPGSELDQLLQHLRTTMSGRAPCARLQGGAFPVDGHSLPVTLSVANRLARPVPMFREPQTPRFLLGFLVTRAPIVAALANQQRAEVIKRVVRNPAELQAWVKQLAMALAGIVGAGDRLADLVGFAADAAFVAAERAKVLLGKPLQWYGTALGGDENSISVLVELSELVETQPELVDEVLCRALLADLRAAYQPTAVRRFFQLYTRDTYCALLIADADSAAVQKFLDIVAQERQRLAWDPLAIVTTSTVRRSGTTDAGTTAAQTTVSKASLRGWQRDRQEQPDSSAGHYFLAWERAAAVGQFAGPADPHPPPAFTGRLPTILSDAERRMVTFVRRVTGDHPSGVDRALRILHDESRRTVRGDPRDLLNREINGRRLDEFIVDELILNTDRLRGIGAQVIYLTMARDAGTDNLNRVFLAAPRLDDPTRLLRFRDQNPWIEFATVSEPEYRPTLHPLARRAIAHRLGRPVGWHNLVWRTVHERLSNTAGADRVTRLYHDLAAGHVQRVAAALDHTLDELRMPEWFAELEEITRAPVRDPAGGIDAQANCELLAGGRNHAESRVSPSLLAAMQLHADPLGDPNHQLCGRIAFELGNLANHAVGDTEFVLRRSEKFRTCSQQWDG